MECLAMPFNALEFPFNLPATFPSLLLPLACFPQLPLSCSFYFLLLHLPPAPSLLRPLLTLLPVFFLPSSSFTFFFVLLVYVISKMDYVLLSVSLPLHLSPSLSLSVLLLVLFTDVAVAVAANVDVDVVCIVPTSFWAKLFVPKNMFRVAFSVCQRGNPPAHWSSQSRQSSPAPLCTPFHCLGTPCSSTYGSASNFTL